MKKSLIILSLLFLVLSSCSNFSYKNLLHIRKGMVTDEVVEVISSFWKPNLDVFMITDARSDTYDLSRMIKSKTKTTILIATKKSVGQKPYYIFAFENDKLIFWGLPVDFKRSANDKFIRIAQAAVKIIRRDYPEETWHDLMFFFN